MLDLSEFFTAVPKKRSVKIRKGKGVLYHNLGFTKRALFYGANFLFVFCFLYLSYLYAPLAKAIISYQSRDRVRETGNLTPLPTPTPVADNRFVLYIPKINAEADVVENVSPYNREEYTEVLQGNKVALAKGSFLPTSGKGRSTYIFAHSTEQGLSMVRNNAVFYLLGELRNQDEVFVNYKGKTLTYRIYDQQVVGATEVEYLSYSDPDREVLILQTCWPIGTDWKRLLVFAELTD